MTDHDQDEIVERQLRDFESVQRALRPRLERAAHAYSQSLTSLWLGNAGAAIATLSFIGAAWHNGNFPHALLLPLTLFVLGLISMGGGSISGLIRERATLRETEEANSILDLKPAYVKRPSEEAGLTLQDWRTRMACVSAAFFVSGCAVGLIELWLN